MSVKAARVRDVLGRAIAFWANTNPKEPLMRTCAAALCLPDAEIVKGFADESLDALERSFAEWEAARREITEN